MAAQRNKSLLSHGGTHGKSTTPPAGSTAPPSGILTMSSVVASGGVEDEASGPEAVEDGVGSTETLSHHILLNEPHHIWICATSTNCSLFLFSFIFFFYKPGPLSLELQDLFVLEEYGFLSDTWLHLFYLPHPCFTSLYSSLPR